MNTYGKLSSAPDGKIIEEIYNFVIGALQNLNASKSENEKTITNRLCKKLNYLHATTFYFHHENPEDEKENTSTDFAVFGTYLYAQNNDLDGDDFPLIKFEAKRLSSNLAKKREKEYVIGEYKNGEQIKNSGGIERFKNERHGKDVIYAAMLGYVQTDTFDVWFKTINNLITEEIKHHHDSTLIWDENDYLKNENAGTTIKCFKSTPKRKSLKPLIMYHIWIQIN